MRSQTGFELVQERRRYAVYSCLQNASVQEHMERMADFGVGQDLDTWAERRLLCGSLPNAALLFSA
jgi:hypothetical protein